MFEVLSTIIEFGGHRLFKETSWVSNRRISSLESDRNRQRQQRRLWLLMVLEEEEENIPLSPLKPVGDAEGAKFV